MLNQENNPNFTLIKIFTPLRTRNVFIIFFITGILLFGISFFNDFVGDDKPQIIANNATHSIKNVPSFFTNDSYFDGENQQLSEPFYRPLMRTVFAFIYTIFGPNAFIYHFFLASLHIINAWLLYLFFTHFLKPATAFFISLLFLIHPLNSEVAFYISDIQESLFFFFGILPLILILKKYDTYRYFIFGGISILLSLFSKETGILFAASTFVYLFFLHSKKYGYIFLGTIFASLAVYLIFREQAIGIISESTRVTPLEKLGLFGRLINAPSVFFFYVRTFFLPIDLSVSYHWANSQINFIHFWVPLFASIVFLSIVGRVGYLIYKRFAGQTFYNYVFFVFWFLLGVAFHMHIIPLDQTVADRWFYFPIVGILGMIGVVFDAYSVNWRSKWVLVPLIVVITLLSVRTFARGFDWKDDFTLASHDIKVSQDAYDLEYLISSSYFQKGEYEKSKNHAIRSIEIYPYVTNYTNLGAAYAKLGESQKAKEAFLKALEYGEFSLTHENLAILSLEYDDPKQSVDFIKNVSIPKYPKNWKLWYCAAVLEYKFGNKENAKTYIQEAYKYNPTAEMKAVLDNIMLNKDSGL